MNYNQKDVEDSARLIGRRALVVGGLQMAVVMGLGARLHHMQVDQADQFRMLAEENRINIRLIPPTRGLIFDRNGGLLAGNEPIYRVVIVREEAGDVAQVLDRLSKLIALSDEDIERSLREIERRSSFVPITVADRLAWEDLARVAVNAPALPGITPEVGLSRHYPQMEDFGHVIGYVGPVSEADLKARPDPEPLLQIPNFQIGKVGVEARMEERLRGRAGSRQIEVNSVGRVMRELGRTPGVAGENLQLTIDRGLQNFVQARLGEESAAVVVMDIASGDLLAITSAPGFNPNMFVRGISHADYRALTDNEKNPLSNKSVQGAYPPGSTYKMVTALAALEGGVTSPEETVWCPGHLDVSGRRFHCWKRGGHGHVDLSMALTQSCDVYFYEMSQRAGIDRINAMSARLGLGIRHDLPLSSISAGLNPSRDWKQERRGAAWQIGDTINASIGQGFVLATPLQLAVMTARLASGRAVEPRLIKSVDGVETPLRGGESLGFARAWLDQIRRGMADVSNSRRGTAYGSRIEDPALRMAGKTGTSQVRNITTAERARGVVRNEDLPWNRRDHALFVAFAPVDAPKIAVSVVVEHGGGGSTAAAPIARDVVLRALHGDLPPLTAYPAAQRGRMEILLRDLKLRDLDPKPGPGSTRA